MCFDWRIWGRSPGPTLLKEVRDDIVIKSFFCFDRIWVDNSQLLDNNNSSVLVDSDGD